MAHTRVSSEAGAMQHVSLSRNLSLFQVTAAGVGIILGAGIYVLIGVAAGQAGNAVWLSFAIASLVAIFTGLSYAELSARYPQDAGEYTYAKNAFGKPTAFFAGYLTVLSQVIPAAAVALGFGGYLATMTNFPQPQILAAAACLFFTWINYRGITGSARFTVMCTILEVVGLVIIIAICLPYIGSVNYLEMADGMGSVFKTASLVFFAYVGFESIVKFAEETKDPVKTMPRAILLSIGISTVLYILVAISAVSVIGWETLGQSKAPLADVAKAIMGSSAFMVLGIIALFSTGNTVLVLFIAASRTLFGIAHEYRFLAPLTQVNPRTRTPHYAVLASLVLTLIFILVKDINMVAEYSNFGIFLNFIIVNGAVIALRFKQPHLTGGFRVPGSIGKVPILPVLGIITSIFLITQLSVSVMKGGIVMALVGLGLYLFFARKA